MSNFSILVEKTKKEARLENIKIVREILTIPEKFSTKDKQDLKVKINNFIERWNPKFTNEEIIENILNNDIVAAMFSKDPSKQNISEKLCADYLNWEILPQRVNAIRFNINGDIVSTKTLGGGKCADFFVKNRYITQKYTGENTGGAQDNQMDDVITFLINASKKHKCGACVDGWYWEEAGNKEKLKKMFINNPNVLIFSADEIKQGVISLE